MTEKDGKLYGRGTCDIKGCLAVVLSLVPTFLKMQRLKPIHFAFSFDEEVSCLGLPLFINYLKEKQIKADWCFVGEPSNTLPYFGKKRSLPRERSRYTAKPFTLRWL
uniref:Acetylornithine deacetylase n=1 Tax=Lygus hesperus TaxID=30085 RepID=A0A0A9ZEI0_LYGHE